MIWDTYSVLFSSRRNLGFRANEKNSQNESDIYIFTLFSRLCLAVSLVEKYKINVGFFFGRYILEYQNYESYTLFGFVRVSQRGKDSTVMEG